MKSPEDMRDIRINLTTPLKEIPLQVEKQPKKSLMLAFETTDPLQTEAYNRAANEVLSEAFDGVNVFQQLGSLRQPGPQKWEIWDDIDASQITSLFEAVQQKASEIYKDLQT